MSEKGGNPFAVRHVTVAKSRSGSIATLAVTNWAAVMPSITDTRCAGAPCEAAGIWRAERPTLPGSHQTSVCSAITRALSTSIPR